MSDVIRLVQTQGQQAFTTSLIVAKGCDNKTHEYVTAIIRKYAEEFQSLGELHVVDTCGNITRFKNGENLSISYYNLNEDQATFLVTLFRNTPTVLKFKLRLVKEFRNALNMIAKNYADPPRTGLCLRALEGSDLKSNPLLHRAVSKTERWQSSTKTKLLYGGTKRNIRLCCTYR